MAIAEDRATGESGFRIQMLWRDERYRHLFLQAVALILLMLGVAWLVNNAMRNLAALGQGFQFSFLFDTAGYDIPFSLIEYSNRDTHLRAAFVGFLNTIFVAVLGCVAATVLGVTAGVARLSKNWLVAKLTQVYVEAFRNVPTLLWIILAVAVLTELSPSPRDYRLPDGGDVTGPLFVTNRGVNIASPQMDPLGWVVLAVVLAAVVGVFFLRRYASARQMATGERLPVLWMSLGLLLIPATVIWFLLGRPIGLEYPELGGFNFNGGLSLPSSLVGLWLGLSLYTGAFIAEIVRSGILSVTKGQSEAAFALGLPPNIAMRLIILPQALRVIVPPLISQYLNLTKNSSLAIAVGFLEATGTLGNITRNQTGRELECIILLMAFYICLSLAISAGMNWYNSRVRLAES